MTHLCETAARVGLSRAPCEAMLAATQCIYICDWMLSPELVSHEAKRFHAAAREASDIAARLHDAVRAGGPPAAAASLALGTNAQPLADYYRRTHFWWKEVVQGPATHAKWNDVFCGRGEHGDDQPTSTAPARTTFASEFCRWESNYPVPEHLRRLER